MSLDATGARNTSGLSVLWDVIVAPRAAFAALRERPYAGWAFLIAAVLGTIGAFLLVPAGEHVTTVTFATNPTHDPRIAALSPAELKKTVDVTLAFQHWFWLATPIIVAIGFAVAAVVMLVANAIGGGDGNFRRLFALASNVGIVTFGLAYLVLGLLALARGADSFSSQRDLTTAIPSLAWVAPPDANKLAAILAAFNPFSLWSLALLGIGMQSVARLKPTIAWITAFVLVVCPALISAAFVK
jgi:Yip1 domain